MRPPNGLLHEGGLFHPRTTTTTAPRIAPITHVLPSSALLRLLGYITWRRRESAIPWWICSFLISLFTNYTCFLPFFFFFIIHPEWRFPSFQEVRNFSAIFCKDQWWCILSHHGALELKNGVNNEVLLNSQQAANDVQKWPCFWGRKRNFEEEVALARVTIESFKATAAAADQWWMGAL